MMPKEAELNKFVSRNNNNLLNLIYFAITLCMVYVYLGPIIQQQKKVKHVLKGCDKILSHPFLTTYITCLAI